MSRASAVGMDPEADSARLKQLRQRLQALIREAEEISAEAAEVAARLRNRAQAEVLRRYVGGQQPRLDA